MRPTFPRYYAWNDIYSTGLCGLIKAAHNAQASPDGISHRYAAIRIRGALGDELRRLDWLSRSQRSRVKALNKSIGQLREKTRRNPESNETNDELFRGDCEYHDVVRWARPTATLQLHSCYGIDGKTPEKKRLLCEIVSDWTELNGREILEEKEYIALVRQKLRYMPPGMKRLLSLYYVKRKKFAAIASRWGLTESRVCQLHADALNALRKAVAADLSRDLKSLPARPQRTVVGRLPGADRIQGE
jgi:RNA polymerase sigma factor for flagellar operon FliA